MRVLEDKVVREMWSHSSGAFVVDKPAGIDIMHFMYRDSGYPRLVTELQKTGGAHVNRIDRWTSGLLVCGSSRESRGFFKKYWADGSVRKLYLAVVENSPTALFRLGEFCRLEWPIDGALAATEFRVLERNSSWILVQCELVRYGRTHQIRRHLRELHSPVAGDWRFKGPGCRFVYDKKTKGYVAEEVDPVLESRREIAGSGKLNQFLHCWRMQLPVPFDGEERVWIQAPMPPDFRAFGFEFDETFPEGVGGDSSLREWTLSPLSDDEAKWDGPWPRRGTPENDFLWGRIDRDDFLDKVGVSEESLLFVSKVLGSSVNSPSVNVKIESSDNECVDQSGDSRS